jgi:hypothetical protein
MILDLAEIASRLRTTEGPAAGPQSGDSVRRK